jgi:hypothetical protein
MRYFFDEQGLGERTPLIGKIAIYGWKPGKIIMIYNALQAFTRISHEQFLSSLKHFKNLL